VSVLTDSAARERLFDEATATVRQYRKFQDDWDSSGSVRPSDKAVSYAERLLASLRTTPDITAPFVAPIDAGVYIEWRLGKSNLYLEIDANSVLTVLRESGSVLRSVESPLSDLNAAIDLIEEFHQRAT
jgi:hypothetical protein